MGSFKVASDFKTSVYNPPLIKGSISFAFASGYVGVLLSPVHLCLVLTREYFGASMGGIYRKTLKVSLLIMAVALIEYLIFGTYLR